MKREAKLLLEKATESLILAIEIFNRPHDAGRVHSLLILLDHSFEMLLKAAIVHRGGAIREKRAKETIGFDACVRRALSTADVKFLSKEQALTLQVINGQRDAAQHYLLSISEGQLYIHAQSGVTLCRDILRKVFEQDLTTYLPRRGPRRGVDPPLRRASPARSKATLGGLRAASATAPPAVPLPRRAPPRRRVVWNRRKFPRLRGFGLVGSQEGGGW